MSELDGSEVPQQTPVPTTVEKHVARLLGGTSKYNLLQAAQILNCGTDVISRFWRAMGFPGVVNPEQKLLPITIST
ncbi:hypothetical protein RQN30_04920 [Arcanobacterium hippocoleae]